MNGKKAPGSFFICCIFSGVVPSAAIQLLNAVYQVAPASQATTAAAKIAK